MAKPAERPRDLAQTLALLWSSHARKIGRTGLSVGDLVDGALALVRENGADALSIRSVAARLGVRAMAMYSVIPGKMDLIALMVDKAFRDVYQAGDPDVANWRKGLREIAAANRSHYDQNPWLHALAPARSAMGPFEARKHEAELRVLDGIGLSDAEMDQALGLVLTHVAQASRASALLQRERKETGLDDSEWWTQAMPVFERVYDMKRFPLCVRVGTAGREAAGGQSGSTIDQDFGLERIIDGIGTLISGRGSR